MRIQILELPRKTVDDPIQFTLIFSEIESKEREIEIAEEWENDSYEAYGDGCVGAFFTTDEVELGPAEKNLDKPVAFHLDLAKSPPPSEVAEYIRGYSRGGYVGGYDGGLTGGR